MNAVPFEEILAPMVGVARDRLAARLNPAGGALLGSDVGQELERLLIGRLAGLSAQCLYLEFTAERAARLSPLGRVLARGAEAPSRVVYDGFVQRMLDGGLENLLETHPVLGRLMSRVRDLWVEAMAEFVERLDSDREQIERVFGGGDELGVVARVEPGLSDPHRGGRMVVGVTFESGVKIAYKPKDLGTERAYNVLLAWFNDRNAPLPFRALEVIARPGYGWAEWAQHAPCLTEPEVHRFYRRAGMLVCLVYALAGTDCHRDNLVAAGEHPVLVDTESLMHHRAIRDEAPGDARGLARDELASGVLGTGLLPSWQVDESLEGRPASDISALHTSDPEELTQRPVRWHAINTDGMALSRQEIRLPLPASQPLLDGRPVRLQDYADDVIAGFELFYRYLDGKRTALLGPASPLGELTEQPVRFLYRNTRVYGSLLQQLSHPPYMRDEAKRRDELEKLGGTALSGGADRSRWRPLVHAEQEAMQQMDVPLFWARADGVDLNLGLGRELRACLSEPSSELVRKRLEGLGPKDMERQLAFIGGSLHSNAAHHRTPTLGRMESRSIAAGRPVALERVALEIAAEMRERAVRAPGDTGATWIAPQYLPQLERYQLQPVGYDLHSGGCGMALFLAAVSRATGHTEYAQLSLAALQPLREALSRDPESLAEDVGFGMASGLGSIVYGLTRIGELLEETALIEAATTSAALLTNDRIATAQSDVFAGLAGEILGQLALHSTVTDRAPLERAEACGRRLIDMRTARMGDRVSWVTFKDRALTGFSHGAAGIAYALLRLQAITGDEEYRQAAIDAIAYEDQLFDVDVGNWRDLREEEQPAYKSNWCHGAPGIGLARVGGLDVLDTPAIRRDIDAAMETTMSLRGYGADHLCCGNLGRADCLLVAGDRLARPDLIAAASQSAELVARRAEAAGGFSLHTFLPRHVYMPGLFMGMAGVGYALLRIGRPDMLPSPLLAE